MNRSVAAFIAAAAFLLSPLCAANANDAFVVALTGKYPPFSFYDATGELTGFDVDVSKAIAQRIDRPLQIVATEWDGILTGLLAHRYDAIIGSMAQTPERSKQVLFTIPYYVSGAQLFIHERHAGEINSIDDCDNHRIGVVLGETFEHYLRQRHPDIVVVTYKSTSDIFQDIQNGRLAGLVTDRLVGAYQIHSAQLSFLPVGDTLYTERMAIPIRFGNEALHAEINLALKDLLETGELQAISHKWFALDLTESLAEIWSQAGSDQQDAANSSETNMPLSIVASMLGKGFLITLKVAVASLTAGFLLAVPLGIVLNNPKLPGHLLVRSASDFIRGTPVLIQLFFVYFGLGSPQVGLNLSPMSAAIITLSINAAAYMAEVVRSGLMSVDHGQALAARALGFSRLQAFTLIIWPQAFRIALPPLMNSVVSLIKDTALISVIAVPEVIREAQSIISVTFNPIRYYTAVAVMFFIVTFPLMKLAGKLERDMRRKGFTHD